MYAGKLSAVNRRDWVDAFEDLGIDRHCEYSPKSQATSLCCTCARHLVEALEFDPVGNHLAFALGRIPFMDLEGVAPLPGSSDESGANSVFDDEREDEDDV